MAAIRSEYYVDEDAALDAARRESSFNVIHLQTMVKVDIFVLKNTSYDRQTFQRLQSDTLGEEPNAVSYPFLSAEDVVLHKLWRFRLGRETSERQWKDAVGVIKVRRDRLDAEYLKKWAEELRIADLLTKALREADG